MSYFRMDHGAWLEMHLRRPLLPFHHRCADIIGIVAGGIYNASINWRSAHFGDRFLIVNWRDPLFATWDFNRLTKLVVLAHAARIRVEVSAVAPRTMQVTFHRRGHEGCIGERHPDMAEAVRAIEAALPPDHSIRYVMPDGGAALPRNPEHAGDDSHAGLTGGEDG